MPRLEFTRKTRRAIFERAAGRCESCRANLKPGEGDFDHILPAELGGKPDASNCQLLCHVCHGNKTRSDVRGIRKADRARDKNTATIKPKGTIPGRPKVERVGKMPLPPRLMFWPVLGSEESGD